MTAATSISPGRLTRAQWSSTVRASSLLTRSERSFAVDLATLMDADGRLCHPRPKIAQKLRTSEAGIDRLRRRLVEVGLLINTLPGHTSQTAEYVGVDPKSASLLTRSRPDRAASQESDEIAKRGPGRTKSPGSYFKNYKERRDADEMANAGDEVFEQALTEARADGNMSRANVIRKIRKIKAEIQARERVTSDAQSVGKSASLHDALSEPESASLVTHQVLGTYATETSTATNMPKPPSPVLPLLRRSDPAPDVTGGSKEEPGSTRRPSPTSPGDWSNEHPPEVWRHRL